MRIIHVIAARRSAGAEKGALELVQALENHQSLRLVLCAIGPAISELDISPLRSPFIELGCPVHSRRQWFARWRRIRGLIDEFQPDVVHSHLWPTAREVAWALSGRNIPHMVHIRDTPPSFVSPRWQSRWKKCWLRYSLSGKSTQFVAVSHDAAKYAATHLGIDSSRMTIVVNGADLSAYLAVKRKAVPVVGQMLVVGTAARLAPEKGLDDLLRAFATLAESRKNITLRIAGSGSDLSRLKSLAADLGVLSRIDFVGHVGEMSEFLASLDLFAFPSIAAEGLPRVVLEAMASGLPVVSTDCEGVEDIAGLKELGMIVPKRDPGALANAIAWFADHPEKRQSRGQQSREAVRNRHSIEWVTANILTQYKRICR